MREKNELLHAALTVNKLEKKELVIGQTAFACSNQVEKVWKQIICCDMFLVKHTAR